MANNPSEMQKQQARKAKILPQDPAGTGALISSNQSRRDNHGDTRLWSFIRSCFGIPTPKSSKENDDEGHCPPVRTHANPFPPLGSQSRSAIGFGPQHQEAASQSSTANAGQDPRPNPIMEVRNPFPPTPPPPAEGQ